MGTEHIQFPARSLHRVLTCEASVYEERKYPLADGDKRATGYRLTRSLCEKTLMTGNLAEELATPEWRADCAMPTDIVNEMVNSAQGFADYVNVTRGTMDESTTIFVEMRLDISMWTVPEQNTVVGAVLYDAVNRVAHLFHLDTSPGVLGVARQNEQLMVGGAAVARDMPCLFGDIDNLVLHVVQPCRNNFDYWTSTPDGLIQWATSKVSPTVQRIVTSEPSTLPFTPETEACRYCRANRNCRALAVQSLALVSESFHHAVAPVVQQPPDSTVPLRDVTELTPHEVFRAYDNIAMIRVWCKAIQAEAEALATSGEVPADCKYEMGLGRGSRRWKDPLKAEKAMMRAGVSIEDRRKPMEPVSVAKAEILLGKDHNLLKNHVEVSPGKPTLVLSTGEPLEWVTQDFPKVVDNGGDKT